MVAAQDMKLDYRKAAVLKSEIDTGCHTYVYIYTSYQLHFPSLFLFALLLFGFSNGHVGWVDLDNDSDADSP